MNELEASRLTIQQCDKEIAELFEKRMEAARGVLNYKMQNGLPIYDPEQEARVIEHNSVYVKDPVIKEYYIPFLKNVMDLSKAYQTRLMSGMKVAYSGIPGAFAHIAGQKLFQNAEFIPCPDFESAYRSCENGEADIVVLPIENSYSGDVGGAMHLAFNGNRYVNMMIDLNVTQNLMGIKGSSQESIKTVVSHPQALAQCARFIKSHGYKTVEFENTARAAKYVAESNDKSIAAIASAETAAEYGLKLLAEHINASTSNTTRFAVFSKVKNSPSGKESYDRNFILMFMVKNEAGALAKALNIIGSHGFNMSNLHSRPTKGTMWSYYFYAELEGNVNSSEGDDLLRQLGTVCEKIKMVGSYKRV